MSKEFEYLTTDNSSWSCDPSDQFNLSGFFACYGYFIRLSLVQTIFQISLGLSIVIANVSTFLLIYLRRCRKTVFDRILMAHAIVEFVIGLFDLPFYHIMSVFGFWPFSQLACIIWSTLDNSVNTIAIFHMVFLQYVRVQCIKNPKSYLQTVLIKHSIQVCFGIWVFGLVVWVSYVFYDISIFLSINFTCGLN